MCNAATIRSAPSGEQPAQAVAEPLVVRELRAAAPLQRLLDVDVRGAKPRRHAPAQDRLAQQRSHPAGRVSRAWPPERTDPQLAFELDDARAQIAGGVAGERNAAAQRRRFAR